jgi:guanine deaminase
VTASPDGEESAQDPAWTSLDDRDVGPGLGQPARRDRSTGSAADDQCLVALATGYGPPMGQPGERPSSGGDLPGGESEAAESELLVWAVRLASENGEAGQLPFAALVVRAGTVLATGVNTALRDRDPTAHAEVAAVRNACRDLATLHLTGATVVSSCEPCAICHAVAASVGVTRVVYAAPKEYVPDLGYPAPDSGGDLMTRMQDVLRATAPDQIRYVPTDGADEPFRRYLAGRERA